MGGPPEVGVLLSVKKRKHGQELSPGCRAVELSRLRRAAVEAVVEALPVEPVEFLSSPVKPRRG